MTKPITIQKTKQFLNDFKGLAKKYQSLEKDFAIFCDDLCNNPQAHIKIDGIGEGYRGSFYKVKKFRCVSLSKNANSSGIRIIYHYHECDDGVALDLVQIEFVEIYHKNTQKDFDRSRLEPYRE